MLLVCDAGKHRSLLKALASLETPSIEFDLVRTVRNADLRRRLLESVPADIALANGGSDFEAGHDADHDAGRGAGDFDLDATHDALRERDETYRVVAESASDPIVTINESGVIIFTNRAAERVFQYSREMMIGSHFTMLMPESQRGQWATMLYNYVETGVRTLDWSAVALMGKRKDDVEIPVEMSFGSYRHEGKRIFTGILRDVSERKRVEQERDELLALVEKERARLDAVLNMVPVGIWESETIPGTDSQRNTFVNRHYEEMTGFAAEEWKVTPNKWLEVLHPDDLPRVVAGMQNELWNLDTVERRFRMITKDGRTIWLVNHLVIRRDTSGAIMGTTGCAIDITDSILADQRYRNIIETSQEGVTLIDTSGRINYCNARMAEMFGYAVEELVGMTIFDLMPPESVTLTLEYMERSAKGEKLNFDLQCRKKDGAIIWCLISTATIRDVGGRRIGGLGMLTDITGRKHAEAVLQQSHDDLEARVAERTAELAEMMSRLEEAYATQKRFIADASHDIRTPLTAVRAELDLLMHGEEIEPPVRNALDRIIPQIKRLSLLTDDLLMLAMLDSKETVHCHDTVQIEDLILESIVDLSTVATERDVCWNISFGGLFQMQCDAAALKRAFANVLQNAVKYSRSGTVIDVELVDHDGAARIIVRDCGLGIKAEDLPNVFNRFYRGDQTRSTQGTGLGLSIVKGVVEGHQGTVSIESEPDVGTTVTITLPL
jgi:PAS domain S-box-containing protein